MELAAAISAPEIPPRIGRYQVVCELGHGGMGSIYLARNEGLGGFEKLVAIKMIHPNLSKERAFINMFLDEARIAALIRHPNVVPVYEVGEQQGRHFIVMEYVSGESFGVLLDNTWCGGTPLDLDIAAYIVSLGCDALHAAHELSDPQGRKLDVVHRDVCPQNIMLGYDGTVRVMDFGVAKALFRLSQTNPGTHKGKLSYMAPEQIRCEAVDRRSDVFALGVILWESTIGKRLFKGVTDAESARKVLKGSVPRPSQLRELYTPELEAIVLKALHPRPEMRFQTAREMGQALREYMAVRGSMVSPSDLESLLKSSCKTRYERRREMERRAASETLEWPLEEDTSPLFPVSDSNLPSFSIDEISARRSFAADDIQKTILEYLEEELDDATIQIQLEAVGFKDKDNSTIRRLVLQSNAAVTARRPTSLSRPPRKAESASPIELPVEAILEPADAPMPAKRNMSAALWMGSVALCTIGLTLFALLVRGEAPAVATAGAPAPTPIEAARLPDPPPEAKAAPVEQPARSLAVVEPPAKREKRAEKKKLRRGAKTERSELAPATKPEEQPQPQRDPRMLVGPDDL